MIKIEASHGRIIWLGYAGEDKVTKVIFPYDESWLDLGEGAFYIRVLRPGDGEPYNAADVTNDSEAMTLTLTVTDVELSKEGYGQMQLVYVGAGFIKKSPIYRYNVSRAVDEAVDPPAQDVYTQIIESLSGLHDTVWDIDRAVAETDARVGNLADLTTTAKTDLVSAINEVNEHGGGSSVTVDDVQINGTSIVSDGVAEIPIAEYDKYGLFKISNLSGLAVANDGSLSIYRATPSEVKGGFVQTHYLSPSLSNYSAFYGLAKAAGHDEKNSALPLGTYSEEAKTAIRTMLGLQDVYDDYSSALEAIGGGS